MGYAYLGWWRVGGDSLSGWPNDPPSDNFAGSIDEVAVYAHPLTSVQVGDHYAAATGIVVNHPRVASFTTSTAGATTSVNASGSTDDEAPPGPRERLRGLDPSHAPHMRAKSPGQRVN